MPWLSRCLAQFAGSAVNTVRLSAFSRARSRARAVRQPYVLNSRGIVLKQLKHLDDAVTSFDTALAIDPNFADAHCNRANALRALKRPSEAIAHQRAFNLRPGFAEACYNCGLALQDLKRHEDARACFLKAISARPDAADFHMATAIHSWI